MFELKVSLKKPLIDGFFLSPLKLTWRMEAPWMVLDAKAWRKEA